MAETKKLNKRTIEALKPKDRLYSVADGEGIRIRVYPKDANGRERSKRWESKVYLNGREISLALGTWPGVTLDMARELHAQYRAEAEAGRDLRELRKRARGGADLRAPLLGLVRLSFDYFSTRKGCFSITS
ncbi:MAG: DUF4102 domain-containing protein [Desulfovibrio sp.]|nr:DUF4102 domain-containing protein [Desulfovibrio sp.]